MKVGEIFGLGFTIFFGLVACFVLYKMIKQKSEDRRIRYLVFTLLAFVSTYVGYYFYDMSYKLNNSKAYVVGTVVNYCRTGSGEIGSGVKFEYIVKGKAYSNCNSRRGLNVELGSEFLVNVSEEYPEYGRIDLERPVEK